MGIKSTSAFNRHSALPGKRLMRHTMACCSGSYLALPNVTLTFDLAVFLGTGILRITLVPNNFSEKVAIILTLIDTLIYIKK
jgi:hypothetical protein